MLNDIYMNHLYMVINLFQNNQVELNDAIIRLQSSLVRVVKKK